MFFNEDHQTSDDH